MIVNLNDILKDAQRNKYAVGLFNVLTLEMARGVLEAAEEMRSPVIIGTAEILLKYTPLELYAGFVLPMAKATRVPVVVHFDHGLTEKTILQALDLGFSSVMYDCSVLPYEENLRKVAKLTAEVHRRGATIEGELGHVGSGANPGAEEDIYTNTSDAEQYAKRTGIDALAVAIGTAHGVYKNTPRLDMERLSEIRSVVETPLVLHGGSGLTNDQFQECIARGICKVNIFTDINQAAARAAFDHYSEGKGASLIIPDVVKAVRETTMEKICIFGSEGKA